MTVHRALGYVDRSAIREGDPLRVIMASEGRMADGIDLRMSGADLRRYRANPVLGYGHAYWGRTNLPIGRVDPGSISVDGTTLAGALEFDAGDKFAMEIERKMRGGFINAVSIGFDVLQWESSEMDYWRGGVATKWELTELSVVPVPMDAAAVVTAGRGLGPESEQLIAAARDLSEAEFERFKSRLEALFADPAARHRLDTAGERTGCTCSCTHGRDLPADTDPAPAPAAAIDPDAARSLLAALA